MSVEKRMLCAIVSKAQDSSRSVKKDTLSDLAVLDWWTLVRCLI